MLDKYLQNLQETFIGLTFLYWCFKALFMVVGVKFTLSGLMRPFKKEKK